VYNVLAGNPGWKAPLGGPKRMWKDSLRIDLKKLFGRLWTGLTWFRVGTDGGHL
jgi:hypothetical protein